jgi:hypothetical protein
MIETAILAFLIACVCAWAMGSEWLRDGMSRVFDARRDHEAFKQGEQP